MGENTGIQWAHHTFNPWWGCVKVSPACDHCYAESDAARYGYRPGGAHFPIWGKGTQRRGLSENHWKQPLKWDRKAAEAGERHRVFCGSMCDVMEDRRDLDLARVDLFRMIEQTPNLDWLLLTKRPQNYRKLLPPAWLDSPRPNVWLGTTVESNEYRWREQELLQLRAAVRFISNEPGLEFVHVSRYIDWVIIGGESGSNARPFDIAWVRQTIEQCAAAGVACFVKQLGARPYEVVPHPDYDWQPRDLHLADRKGGDPSEWPADLRVRQIPTPRGIEAPACS